MFLSRLMTSQEGEEFNPWANERLLTDFHGGPEELMLSLNCNGFSPVEIKPAS